jgi:predicted nucleotidyltransferase
MEGCNPTEEGKERVTSELCGWTPIRSISDHDAMTKVDERAFVPEIDDDALRRLSEALDKDGVVAAMLIGSQARGEAGPLSDIDIAVWHEPGIERKHRWNLQMSLMGAAQAALKTDEVDVVMLNNAPPLLQQRAIRDAVRLVERDRDQRVRFETRAILDYLDTQPLRDELRLGIKHQIREGRFGRSRKSH